MPNVELSRLWNVAKAFFFYAVTYLGRKYGGNFGKD